MKVVISILLCAFSILGFASVKEIQGENLLTGAPVHYSTEAKDKKGLIVVFLSAKCPCSDSHTAEIKKLAEQYKNFQFIAVHSNPDESKEVSQRYFQEAHLPFDVIQDHKTTLANEFKAFKTPHAFLINSQGEILFQGGVTNSADCRRADRHFLAEALEDLAQNRKVRTPSARTLGCAIVRESEKNVW